MRGRFQVIISELTRALAVLAFAFLSFAHQPLPVDRYGASEAVTTAFYCGASFAGDPTDDSAKTFRCDACRIATAIDLPAPPSFACPLFSTAGRTPLPAFDFALPSEPARAGGGPRAPPLAAFA